MRATDGTTIEYLCQALVSAFPDRHISFGIPPAPVATFAPDHPALGDLRVWFFEYEVILQIGTITQIDFSELTCTHTPEDGTALVTEHLLEFLSRLFADRVLFWCYPWGVSVANGLVDLDTDPPEWSPDPDAVGFVWSGPLRPIPGRLHASPLELMLLE